MTVANDSEGFLQPIEAAYFLGITPELLFSYVRNAPKSGDNRRLPTVQDGGQTLFRRSDLEAFDAYLREPWSTSGQDRPGVPTYVVEHLKVECCGQCPRCGRGFKLETAHIEDYAQSRSHHHHNLIRLCTQCHEEFDAKRILPAEEISTLKSALIARTRERLVGRTFMCTPAQFAPPRPTPNFVGRDVEIQSLAQALLERRTVGIRGLGGIGKTQLVLNVLNKVESQNQIVWIDVEAFSTVADLDLGVKTAIGSIGNEAPSSPLWELLDQTVGILVFDGVESITQARIEELEDYFSEIISRTKKTKIILTSQADLLGINIDIWFELSPLKISASREIIMAAGMPLPSSPESQASIAKLLEFSDGHPLTLKIVGGLLRYFKSAQAVASRIKKQRASGLIDPTRHRQSKRTSLGTCLAVAYSTLTPDERSILYLASHCPAGSLAAMFIDDGEYRLNDAEAAIAALERWHFVDASEGASRGSRLRVLSPIRAFAQQMYEQEQANAAEAAFLHLARGIAMQAVVLDAKYMQTGDVAYGMIRFRQEVPNFLHIFDESVRRSKGNSDYLELIEWLASSLQVFCFLSGFGKRGIEIMRSGATAALRMGKAAEASGLLLNLIANAQRTNDQLLLKATVQELSDLAKSDPQLAGDAAMANGLLAQSEGKLHEAEQHFISASECYSGEKQDWLGKKSEDVGRKDVKTGSKRMLAFTLMELGRVHEHSRRPSEALERFSAALSLMIDTDDGVNIGSVLHHMGNCYSELERREEAFAAYIEATQRFFEIQAAGHLSNSVGELGYLLIDFVPELPLDEFLSRPLLEASLVDVLWECRACFGSTEIPLRGQECIRTVRKLFGVTAAVSLTPHNSLLASFANEIRDEILLPLSIDINNGVRRIDGDGVPIMHLDVTTALMGSVSGKDQGLGSGVAPTLSEIEHLAQLCYMQYEWAWRHFRLFEWLEVYLFRCRGTRVAATSLRIAAHAAAQGRKFVLAEFDAG